MNAAPQLTPELRAELETEYNDNRRISAFLVWNSRLTGTQLHDWFKSVADAYDFRYDMVNAGLGYTTEEFLVVNTFKEFETGE